MPFKSEAQRRACWAQYNQAKRAGKKPSWDCVEWERSTVGKLPEKVKATMPAGNTLLLVKQDLESFTTTELKTLARYYQIPININDQDLRWIISIYNFLD